jgi:hypothetical protein
VTLEFIGILSLIAGFISLIAPPSCSVVIFTCFTLLGAASATVLTSLSGANISPSHLLLAFLFADLLLRPALLRQSLACFRLPAPGFWLLMTVAYGVAATVILPRLFAGATYVFSPARSESGSVSLLFAVPLAPSGANFTQSIYLISSLVCFFVLYAHSSRSGGARMIVKAVTICSLTNLMFAGLDLLTYHTNKPEVLSFVRNSNYRLLDDVETAGLKRIVGSFTEAGSFAYTTVALVAFNLRLWSEGIVSARTGPIALASLITVLFATSSTGYIGLVVTLAMQLVSAVYRVLTRSAAPNAIALLAIAPVVFALVVSLVLLVPGLNASVAEIADTTIFNKLSSESGIERSAWNRQAIAVFQDTIWMGAGIGSLRASSWLIAVPASVGVIGAVLYGAFVLALLSGRRQTGEHAEVRAVRLAARDACFVQLVAASVTGAFIDLGLFFFLFAGVACGLRRALHASSPARRPLLGLLRVREMMPRLRID